MKKGILSSLIATIIFCVFFTGFSWAQDEETSFHRRLIFGVDGSKKIVNFDSWESPKVLLGGATMSEYHIYSDTWEPVTVDQDGFLTSSNMLSGTYLLTFEGQGSAEVTGYVRKDMGGIGFETINWDQLHSFSKKDAIIDHLLQKIESKIIKKYGESMTDTVWDTMDIWLCRNTEGLDLSPSSIMWDGMMPGKKVLAIIPTNSMGKVTKTIVFRDRGNVSLLANLPYFMVTVNDEL